MRVKEDVRRKGSGMRRKQACRHAGRSSRREEWMEGCKEGDSVISGRSTACEKGRRERERKRKKKEGESEKEVAAKERDTTRVSLSLTSIRF